MYLSIAKNGDGIKSRAATKSDTTIEEGQIIFVQDDVKEIVFETECRVLLSGFEIFQ